jgi:N-acetylmuramoyl-L-alanine amidase
MRAHLGMISLFAVALPLLHGAAWGETPVTEKPAPSADKPKASGCDHHAFRAVIDVGHTQALGGATSARGIYEYEFNLRLAKQVAHNWLTRSPQSALRRSWPAFVSGKLRPFAVQAAAFGVAGL